MTWLVLLVLLIVAVLAFVIICAARPATWEAVKGWFGHSTTILWARVVALAGAALAALGPALNLVNDPTVSTQVQAILDPKYVPYYVLAIGVITEICRWRTASKSDGS